MSNFKKFFVVMIVVAVVGGVFHASLSSVAQAADPITDYKLLSPLPCPTGSPNCSDGSLENYNFGGDNSFAKYLNIMITIFLGICAVLAMIMIVVGGLEYMTSELPGNKESGKNKITNAIFGLVLALSAWLILNTINPQLLKADLESLAAADVLVSLGGESNTPFTPLSSSALQSIGIKCNASDGIAGISQSYINRSVYSQENRNKIIDGKAHLDCSSFVAQVYSCAGLSSPGGNTTDMFSSGSTQISSQDITTSNGQVIVKGVPLKEGDLLGWKPGDGGRRDGHVVMYIGNGKIIDAQGSGVGVTARPLSDAMKSMVRYVKRR